MLYYIIRRVAPQLGLVGQVPVADVLRGQLHGRLQRLGHVDVIIFVIMFIIIIISSSSSGTTTTTTTATTTTTTTTSITISIITTTIRSRAGMAPVPLGNTCGLPGYSAKGGAVGGGCSGLGQYYVIKQPII